MIESRTLYDIGREGLEIQSILMDNEGELTPELEERIDLLLRQGKDKIEAAAMVVKQLEAEAQLCKDEAARLANRAKGFESNSERLKGLMCAALDFAFDGKVKTARFTVWTQKTPDRTVFALKAGKTVDDLEKVVPEAVKVEKTIRSSYLLDLYKAGDVPEVVEAMPVEGTRYTRIG